MEGRAHGNYTRSLENYVSPKILAMLPPRIIFCSWIVKRPILRAFRLRFLGKDHHSLFERLLKVFFGKFSTNCVLNFAQRNHLIDVDLKSRINRNLDVGIARIHAILIN